MIAKLLKAHAPASATVEGALVIPLFVYAAAAIIFMLQVVAVRTRVNIALYNTIREFNRYAYIYEIASDMSSVDADSVIDSLKDEEEDAGICKDLLTTGAFTAVFISELGEDFAENNYIAGGNAGWIFLGSEIAGDDSQICIKLNYVIKNPFDIFGKAQIKVSEKKVTDAWLGESKDSYEDTTDGEDETIVYITPYGSVYHSDISCTYISRNILSANKSQMKSLRNESGEIYYECSKCAGNSEKVYYTKYGNKYHTNINCYELQRRVIAVKIGKVGDRSPCSKCGSS